MNWSFLLQRPKVTYVQHRRYSGDSNACLGAFWWIQKSTPPNTWLRLRDYQIHKVEYPLIKERNGVSITAWGIGYYERTFARYHELYPDVAVLQPREQHDPLEPFVEVLQDHRTCRACGGEYLVTVTRSFQQDQQASRIPGRVTSKYGEVEQCTCRRRRSRKCLHRS